MQWYWESVHYKAALGDRILAVVLDHPTGTAPPADFGVALTPDTLERHLAHLRLSAERFAAAQSPFRDVVRALHSASAGRARD
jgi:hypothetical protein